MRCICFPLVFLVTSVGIASESQVDLQRASARIDALVDANLEKQGIQPNPSISDEAFLRRAWLNIGGRIPTIAEAAAFHQSTGENKREKLIGDLLNSEAYISHFFNFWADILRINDGLNQGLSRRPRLDEAGLRQDAVDFQQALRTQENSHRFRNLLALATAIHRGS